MKFWTILRLAFWIAVAESVFLFLNQFSILPEVHWLAVAFLGISIFLFKERPIVRAGFAPAVETGVAALFGVGFLLHTLWILAEPRLTSEMNSNFACSSRSIELQCYTFSIENCNSLWTHFNQECRDLTQKENTARATSFLVGPRIRKCTYRKLDQSFRSNRRTPTNPICERHFSSLEGLANQ